MKEFLLQSFSPYSLVEQKQYKPLPQIAESE